MFKRIQKKLRSSMGESIAETLIALLISSLALVMLAGAISTTWNLVNRSDMALKAYYEANNVLEDPETGASWTVSLVTGGEDPKPVQLVKSGEALTVSGAVNDTLGNKPVAAYRVSQATGEGG